MGASQKPTWAIMCMKFRLSCDIETEKENHLPHSATLTCDDRNGNIVFSKEIEYTNFPLDEITLYFRQQRDPLAKRVLAPCPRWRPRWRGFSSTPLSTPCKAAIQHGGMLSSRPRLWAVSPETITKSPLRNLSLTSSVVRQCSALMISESLISTYPPGADDHSYCNHIFSYSGAYG
jgi:hypothetical protein